VHTESIKHYQLALDTEVEQLSGLGVAVGAMTLRIYPTSSSEEVPRIELVQFNSGSGHFMSPTGPTILKGLDAAIAAGWFRIEDLDSARIRLVFPTSARIKPDRQRIDV